MRRWVGLTVPFAVHRHPSSACFAAPPRALAAGLLAAGSRPAPPGARLRRRPTCSSTCRRSAPREAIEIADRTPQVRGERSRHPDLRPDNITLFKGSGNWGISYLSGRKKLADVTVDGRTGRVIEAWQGVQADWVMARGHHGYFGERFDAWYIWLPLCLLFVAPFFDPRRPFRMLHLDLLVLVGGFGVSHFFFNKGEIGTSVPLVYPVLAYLLVRMLVAGFRPRRTARAARAARARGLFVVGIVLLGGFRVGLDLTDGKVGDVGYASAVGATGAIEHGKPLYKDSGAAGSALRHLRAGQLPRLLAVREGASALPEGGREPDDYKLPAARAATLAFDLLTIVGLFLLGGRLRAGAQGACSAWRSPTPGSPTPTPSSR